MQRILFSFAIVAATIFSACERAPSDAAGDSAGDRGASRNEAEMSAEEERANATGYRYGHQTTESTLPFRVGGLAPDDFTRRAQRYEAEVVAVEVGSARPGPEDESLVVEYATLATRHAAACRQAMENLQRPALKLIAGAGAAGQDVIVGKLRTIAEGGNFALPSVTDSTESAIGEATSDDSAEEFDRVFLEETFLRNSIELRSLADRLRDQSSHPSLPRLAEAAGALLDFHLEIARAELADGHRAEAKDPSEHAAGQR